MGSAAAAAGAGEGISGPRAGGPENPEIHGRDTGKDVVFGFSGPRPPMLQLRTRQLDAGAEGPLPLDCFEIDVECSMIVRRARFSLAYAFGFLARSRQTSPPRVLVCLLLGIGVGLLSARVEAQPVKNAPQSSVPLGGRARVQFFGITADGFKFVFVLDRSASMAGSQLDRAKAELKASLEGLGSTHQFQIVFYNERPKTFALAGVPGRAVFGSDENKEQAYRHIDGIVADGGTEHEPALLAAFGLSPDVIFFLTDADKPALSAERVAKLTDRNRSGAILHTIQFGVGAAPGANFLSRLAAQNRGAYRYLDTTNKVDSQPGEARR